VHCPDLSLPLFVLISGRETETEGGKRQKERDRERGERDREREISDEGERLG